LYGHWSYKATIDIVMSVHRVYVLVAYLGQLGYRT
jgi:hypothetical protein